MPQELADALRSLGEGYATAASELVRNGISGAVVLAEYSSKELIKKGLQLKLEVQQNVVATQLLEALFSPASVKRKNSPPAGGEAAKKQKGSPRPVDAVDALKFLYGTIENGKVSHYLAVYDVDKDENGDYDFTSHTLKSVATDVKTTLEEKVKKISLDEKITVMRNFAPSGKNNFDPVASVYEGLIADHLMSDGGVKWEQRSVSTADLSLKAKQATQSAPTASRPATVKLNVKLAKSEDTVPVFAEMKPNVLCRSLNKSFPFCDMLYLKDAGSGATTTMMKKKLVCVQVSIEGKGKRIVDLGVFSKFCERLGWGPTPTPEQLDLIEYVYCPLPSLAEKAAVTFDKDVGISEYSVWHVDPKFRRYRTT